MPPVPSVPGVKVVRALEKNGWWVARIHGSHHVMRHADGRTVTVPVHRGKDIPKGTLRSILKDAEMAVDELIDLI